MLVRNDGHGVLVIGQPSHAWISGQLARVWGNERFGTVDPYEEVCLAAEQHDIGMALWDLDPARNPDTELPASFMQMAIEQHVELWTAAPRRLLRQSRYAALLVSMHGTRLYAHRDLSALPRSEAALVREFLDDQHRFQHELLATLRGDPRTAGSVTDPLVARNSGLIGTWDALSLAICLDYAPYTVTEVPTATGPDIDLGLTACGPGQLTLDPWPLGVASLEVRCEGQRLSGGYEDDGALRAALASAPWETLEFELRPT
ncbi:MAG TPA: DUF3891 family protein [Solirubrobacteraceae bacterium]|jgi:hypothetical protein